MSWLLQNLLNICFPFSCKLQLTDSLVCMLTLMYIPLIQFYKIKIQECYRIVLQIDSRNINFFDIPIILFSFKNFPCANGILSFDNALLLKQSSLFWAIFLAVNLFSWNQVFVPSWYLEWHIISTSSNVFTSHFVTLCYQKFVFKNQMASQYPSILCAIK